MDPDSRQKRMNVGGVYEAGINGASRDVTRELRRMAGIDPYLERNIADVGERRSIVHGQLNQLPKGEETLRQIWDYYLGYVKTCSQKMFDKITQEYDLPPHVLLNEVLADGIRLWMPVDNPNYLPEVVRQIKERYPIVFGPVEYKGVMTEAPVLIGSAYILLLEKTGSEFSAASSAKLQHFGLPSKENKLDKFTTPVKTNPVRILGESEVRLMSAMVGSDVVADLIDLSNNPSSHREIVRRIHESPTPSRFVRIIDRGKNPLGNSRPLLFVQHMMQCAGIKFERVINDPYRQEELKRAEQEFLKYQAADKEDNYNV